MTAIQKIRMAERAVADEKLSDGSARLILLLIAMEQDLPQEFSMSHKQVSRIIGITDKATIYARIRQLCQNYLVRVRLSGCPRTWKFRFATK